MKSRRMDEQICDLLISVSTDCREGRNRSTRSFWLRTIYGTYNTNRYGEKEQKLHARSSKERSMVPAIPTGMERRDYVLVRFQDITIQAIESIMYQHIFLLLMIYQPSGLLNKSRTNQSERNIVWPWWSWQPRIDNSFLLIPQLNLKKEQNVSASVCPLTQKELFSVSGFF